MAVVVCVFFAGGFELSSLTGICFAPKGINQVPSDYSRAVRVCESRKRTSQ